MFLNPPNKSLIKCTKILQGSNLTKSGCFGLMSQRIVQSLGYNPKPKGEAGIQTVTPSAIPLTISLFTIKNVIIKQRL